MRLLPALTLMLLPLPLLAQEAEGPAIEAVIADQLSDFAARDVAGAWEHASPSIQGVFGSPGTFGSMVETGYPMVWSNDGGEFLDLREEAGAPHQRVMVRDGEGRGWILDYEMVELPEAAEVAPGGGGWRINGVSVLPAPELAA